MILLLADNDVVGQARILFGAVSAAGWLELVPMRLMTLDEVGLPRDSSDRAIWELCQERQMILITGNRAGQGDDSLGAVLRSEASAEALPVLTISDRERIGETVYLRRCVVRLVEVVIDVEKYRGAGRIFLP